MTLGYIPTYCSNPLSVGTVCLNADGSYAYATRADVDYITSLNQKKIEEDSQHLSSKPFDPNFWRGFGFEGLPPPQPDPEPILVPLGRTKRSNNPDWRNARKSGKIVVGDFYVGSLIIQHRRGRSRTHVAPGGSGRTIFEEAHGLSKHPLNGGYVWVPGINKGIPIYFMDVYFERYDVSNGELAYDFGWSDDELIAEMGAIAHYFEPDTDLVAETLANANRGDVDGLTAIAEMPETIESIYELLKSIIVGVKAIKKREVQLWSTHRKGLRHLRKMHRNNPLAMDKAIAREVRQYMDALASLRLKYSYEIMPNVYLIEDLYEVLINPVKTYVTQRKGVRNTIDFSDNAGFMTDSKQNWERAFCKRSYGVEQFEQLNRAIFAEATTTAYELIPGSFVLDWAWNLGDRISAYNFLAPDFFKQSVFTYSHKFDNSLLYHRDGTDATVTVDFKFYNRKVINPYDHLCIKPSSDLLDNLKRQLDGLALIWTSFSNRTRR